MRVLVTGACGFVGHYLANVLRKAGHEVLGTVFELEGKHYPQQTEFQTTSLDITNSEACQQLVQEFSPEVVYHLAGIAFAPLAAREFDRAMAVNVNGVYRLCEALPEGSTFVLASSGEVYGKVELSDLPLDESFEAKPANPYSLTKLLAENVVSYAARKRLLKGYVLRPFNHIGPGQAESFVAASFAAQLARIALGLQQPVIRVGNLEAERDFMDVRDVVRAYQLVLGAPPGTYNLSSGTSVSIQALLDILIDISGIDVRIEQDPDRMRPSEVREVRGSFERSLKAFGWKPEIDIETSLRDIYSYWLSRLTIEKANSYRDQ
ncbi:MAG: SDR family NAD(P)-dependent oxidoreductase [Bdellovibrionales bacterium]|nr:SDR family NAD(P)-dependent oxidoreductase [Bdellovibrionales bacterium]